MRFSKEKFSRTVRAVGLSLLALAIICGNGNLTVVSAQKMIELPDAAALPEGNGAWVIDQFYHSNVINGFAAANPNNTRILVQSDGTVFRRRTIQYREFANDSGWCQDRFTSDEMQGVRAAMAKFRPNIWKDHYGPLPNALAPFGTVNITWRTVEGKAVDHTIKLFRFDELPPDLVILMNKVGEAGDLAFSNCQKQNGQ